VKDRGSSIVPYIPTIYNGCGLTKRCVQSWLMKRIKTGGSTTVKLKLRD